MDLARAEFGAILGEVRRLAVLGGIALSLVLFAGMLVPIGLTLFLGEWVFGSMGWGILHGTEVSLVATLIIVAVALGIDRGVTIGSLIVGAIVGIVVAVVLALNLTNRAWSWLGDQTAGNVAAESRPLVVAIVSLAVLFGALGVVFGLLSRSVANVIRGLVIGVLLGVLLGAVSAVAVSLQVAAAIGLTVGLLVWTGALGYLAFREGVDFDTLKARFMPSETMETTRETIEWVRQRVPVGRR